MNTKASSLTLGIFLFTLLFLFAGCGSQKDIAEIEAQRPQWAKSKPVTPGYYTGLGAAPKAGNPQYYQQLARSNALKDIAEEISVNISSSSALRTMEFDDSFTQQYTSNIVTNSSQNLEGYELVDTYEDVLYYFVLYRLSKSGFENLKQERIRVASEKAKSQLNSAMKAQQNNEYLNALDGMIKALESIRPHLHESLETNYNGEQVYLGNFITRKIQKTLQGFDLLATQKIIRVKRGTTINQEKLKFFLKDKSGHPVKGMKLKADFSAQMLVKNTALTNGEGKATFSVDKILSESESGIFRAFIDLESVLESSTQDIMVRKMIREMSMPEARINIKIETPSFFIIAKTRTENSAMLEAAFSEKLHQRGFKITNSRREADFILELGSASSMGSKVKNMQVAWLSMEISIKNSDRELVYSHSENEIKGIQMSKEQAIKEAFKNGAEEIKNRIFDDFYFRFF